MLLFIQGALVRSLMSQSFSQLFVWRQKIGHRKLFTDSIFVYQTELRIGTLKSYCHRLTHMKPVLLFYSILLFYSMIILLRHMSNTTMPILLLITWHKNHETFSEKDLILICLPLHWRTLIIRYGRWAMNDNVNVVAAWMCLKMFSLYQAFCTSFAY